MIERVLRCDLCDVAGDSTITRPIAQIRKTLRAAGWTNVKKRDYCPSCSKTVKKAKSTDVSTRKK